MHPRLGDDELAILLAIRPDLGHVWDRVRAGELAALTPRQEVHWLLGKSGLHERQGQFALAMRCARQAQALAEAGGWNDLHADSLVSQSSFHYSLGQFAQARAAALASLAIATGGISEVVSLNVLGLCAFESAQMDVEAAAAYFHRAADLSRMLDYPLGHAMALNWLGQSIYRVRGELDLMLAACDEANQILAKIHFPYNGHYYVYAYYHWLKCDRAALRLILDQMRAIEPFSVFAAGARAYYTAMLALDDEDYAAAVEAISELRALATATGHLEMECWVRLATSRLHLLSAEAATALSWARDAAALARRKGSPYLELAGHIAGAQVALASAEEPVWEAEMAAATQIARQPACRLELAQLSLLRASWSFRQGRGDAERAWLESAELITRGNYAFILERERLLAFPLLAAHSRSENADVRKSADSLLGQLAKVAPLPLRITCLGKFEVWQGRRRIPEREWSKRHAGELFRFLLLQARHEASDETLFEALCPEQTPAAARTLLHHATSTLRHILEPDLPDKFPSRYMRTVNRKIVLSLPPGSSMDFKEFERALQATAQCRAEEHGARDHNLERALEIYGGELLPGDRYADWAVASRARLSEMHHRGQLELARRRLANGEPQGALDLCRTLVSGDPWNEAAVLLGMQACVLLNDRPAALLLYQNLAQALRADLHISPRKDVQALAASLRDA